jgi:hypothetical protein
LNACGVTGSKDQFLVSCVNEDSFCVWSFKNLKFKSELGSYESAVLDMKVDSTGKYVFVPKSADHLTRVNFIN